jgi:hypothetical protein
VDVNFTYLDDEELKLIEELDASDRAKKT